MDETDVDLVRRARTELPHRYSAFEELVKRHYPDTRKLIAGVVGSPDEADSLAQDAMLRMMRGLPRLEDEDRFAAWLRRIAVNVTKTYLTRRAEERRRQASYDAEFEEEATVAGDSPADAAAGAEASSLAEMLEPLSPDERVIVSFKVLQDLEFGEIASILDISLSAAKMRYYRAIEKLRMAQLAESRDGVVGHHDPEKTKN